jgi:hypothetical protein
MQAKDCSIEVPFREDKCGTFVFALGIASWRAVEISRA